MTEQPKHVWPSTWRLNAGSCFIGGGPGRTARQNDRIGLLFCVWLAGSSKLLTVRLFVGDLTVSGGTLSVSRQPGDGQKASVNLEAVGDDCSRTVPLAACDPQSFLEVVLQDLDRDQEQHDALSFAASLVTSEGSKFQKWESVPCAPFICSGSSRFAHRGGTDACCWFLFVITYDPNSIPELLTIALRPDDTPLPVAVLSALSSAEVEPTKDIFPGICVGFVCREVLQLAARDLPLRTNRAFSWTGMIHLVLFRRVHLIRALFASVLSCWKKVGEGRHSHAPPACKI